MEKKQEVFERQTTKRKQQGAKRKEQKKSVLQVILLAILFRCRAPEFHREQKESRENLLL